MAPVVQRHRTAEDNDERLQDKGRAAVICQTHSAEDELTSIDSW